MKHARDDYDRIQDPSGKIPEHEPVFLIRGQDKLAAETLRFYATLAGNSGVHPDMVSLVFSHADLIEKWQGENTSKTPDL